MRQFFCFWFALLSLHCCASQGPVLHLKFDESSGPTAVDSSGKNNNGTLVNNPSRVAGINNSCLLFDGTSQYVEVPHNASIDPVAAWTLSAFVRTASTDRQHSVIEKYGTMGGNYALRISDTNHLLVNILNLPSGNTALAGTTVLSANVWYHIAATFDDATDELKVYVNGILENTASVSFTPGQSSTAALKIGSRGDDNATKLSGSIDDVRIYDRALSAAEIQAVASGMAIANADTYGVSNNTPLTIPSPGVIANDFNASSLTAILDMGVSHGSLAFNADGSFTYSSNSGYIGSDSFTYRLTDGVNMTAPASVSLSVVDLTVTSISPNSAAVGAKISNVVINGSGFKAMQTPSPTGAVGFNGHNYLFVNSAKTWTAAKAYCSGLGGHLATISNAAENNFVYNLGNQQSAWIGLTDEVKEGTFVNVTGEPLSYSNWDPGEPNNSNGGVPENYVELFGGREGRWNDAASFISVPFVCEFEPLGNSVKLRNGAAEIVGSNVRFSSGSQLLANFDLAGATPGSWDLVITDLDSNASVTLPAAFTVIPVTRWKLTIPIPGTYQVPSGSVITPVFAAATFGDSSGTINYMEITDTDFQTGGRNYDCNALLHSDSNIDNSVYTGKAGAGQIARETAGYPDTMTFYARYDFDTGVFSTSSPGVDTFIIQDRKPLVFGTPKTLYARCWFGRGDGHPGPTITNLKILTDITCVQMPGGVMQSASQNVITWRPSPADAATTQQLYRASSPTGPFTIIKSFSDNTTSSFLDSTMTAGAMYYFKIVPLGAGGIVGADSNVLTATGASGTTVSAAQPANITYGTPAVTLSATVNSTQTVNSGTITFQLKKNGTDVGTPVTSNVAGGIASANYLIPAGSSIGAYSINVSYSGSSTLFASNNNSTSLTINAAPLTLSANNLSRAYGSSNPTLTGTLTGVKNGENITASYSTSATASSVVGSYSIIASLIDPGGKLSNYAPTVTNGSLVVSTAPLTVTAANLSRLYAATNPLFTGTISGIKNSDNITATYSCQANALSTVGGYAITITLSDPGGKLSNYTLTKNNGTLTINKATLTTAASNAARRYGGNNPIFSGTLTGVLNNDNILAVYESKADASSIVGNYAIEPTLLDPDGRLINYNVTKSNGTLTVGKAPLTVSADNVSRVYGSTGPLTGSVVGIKNNDAITGIFASSADADAFVGTYPITASVSDPGGKIGNYNLVLNHATLTITKAPLTVTPANVARTYGEANPALTGTIAGIQNNDAISADYSTAATVDSAAGDYDIIAMLNDPQTKLGNYEVTLNKGVLTINKATPIIIWNMPAKIVAGVALSDVQLNAAAEDPITSTALAGTFQYSPAAGTVLAPGLAQNLSVTFTPNDSANYTTAEGSTTIDVDPAIAPAITSSLDATTVLGEAFTYTIAADGSEPLAYAATGMPEGLTLGGNTISGNTAAAGVFYIHLAATNYGGSDSKDLKLIVTKPGTNHAPVITSVPSASANPATAGVAVVFSGAATDSDGDALDYSWAWGDETFGSGASASKIYDAAGVYVVTLTVSDGVDSDVITLNVVVGEAAGVFTVTKFKVDFNFVAPDKDTLSFSGDFPLPASFIPAGKAVRVLVGGVDYNGTLNTRNATADKAFTLKGRIGPVVKYSFALKKANVFNQLADLGISRNAGAVGLEVPVIVVIDGNSHLSHATVDYTVKLKQGVPQRGTGKQSGN